MWYNHNVQKRPVKRTSPHIFAVRTKGPDLQRRLVEAAHADGRTVPGEIAYLLDVRDRLHDVLPDHPLARQPHMPADDDPAHRPRQQLAHQEDTCSQHA